MVTRKMFEAVATALAETRPTDSEIAWEQWCADVQAIASVFASDNPRFDVSKFTYACASREGKANDE